MKNKTLNLFLIALIFSGAKSFLIAQDNKMQTPTMSSGYSRLNTTSVHPEFIVGQFAAGNTNDEKYHVEWGFFLSESQNTTNAVISNDTDISLSVQISPNPFSSETQFKFTLAEKDNVLLKLYNEFGDVISTLVDAALEAGPHIIIYHQDNTSSGVYYYNFKTSLGASSGKIVLVK